MKTEALFETRNDLREATRGQMVELLNGQLADGLDLQLQLKHAHWNVKGPSFFALHELFDKLYADVVTFTDTIAERATALGGVARGTARQVAADSDLAEYPPVEDGLDHVQALVERYGTFAASTRTAIDTATAAGDQGTADLFTEVSRELDKHLWFLEAHLHGNGARR